MTSVPVRTSGPRRRIATRLMTRRSMHAPAVWVFAAASETPGRVREVLKGWFAGRGLDTSTVDDVVLAANELVTNAVTHAEGGVVVSLRLTSRDVVLEVGDHGAGEPEIPPAEKALGGSGRGLIIVESLARSWGVRRDDDGKVVWARIPVRDNV